MVYEAPVTVDSPTSYSSQGRLEVPLSLRWGLTVSSRQGVLRFSLEDKDTPVGMSTHGPIYYLTSTGLTPLKNFHQTKRKKNCEEGNILNTHSAFVYTAPLFFYDVMCSVHPA